MKTKEQIKAYNKEYFARPEVIARAKVRNAARREKRKEYKKTTKGKLAERRWREGHYERTRTIREQRYLQRYGMTLDDFDRMMTEQDGKCAICNNEQKRLHIDHCHATGRVRGLLCTSCNLGLGLLKDDESLLAKAIKYLE